MLKKRRGDKCRKRLPPWDCQDKEKSLSYQNPEAGRNLNCRNPASNKRNSLAAEGLLRAQKKGLRMWTQTSEVHRQAPAGMPGLLLGVQQETGP